jgi:hypothetical protein
MTDDADNAGLTGQSETVADVVHAVLALTPHAPAAPTGPGTWTERRRTEFDTLDPYGDA